jgi:hypothetical protein
MGKLNQLAVPRAVHDARKISDIARRTMATYHHRTNSLAHKAVNLDDFRPHTVVECPDGEWANMDLTKVYVFEVPGVVKVGISNNPMVRVRSVRSDQGFKKKPKVHSVWLANGCEAQAVERRAHLLLSDWREESLGREWFRVTADEAVEALREAAAMTDPAYEMESLRKVTDLICVSANSTCEVA